MPQQYLFKLFDNPAAVRFKSQRLGANSTLGVFQFPASLVIFEQFQQ